MGSLIGICTEIRTWKIHHNFYLKCFSLKKERQLERLENH